LASIIRIIVSSLRAVFTTVLAAVFALIVAWIIIASLAPLLAAGTIRVPPPLLFSAFLSPVFTVWALALLSSSIIPRIPPIAITPPFRSDNSPSSSNCDSCKGSLSQGF
jgi:hypothetical protein